MTLRRALGVCTAALALAAAGTRPAAAQSYLPLAERSLLTTDARDERAVWVNPAGLSRSTKASVAADLTILREAGDARLAQYGVALSSRSLAFGWEHDRYPDGAGANTFVLGLGLGDELFSGGFTHRWHQDGQGSWDVGFRGRATEVVDLSVVWRDIGSPLVRGVVLRDSFVPAVALRLLGGALSAGVEGDLPGDLGTLTEIRAGAGLTIASRVVLACRATFSSDVARRGVVVLLGFGAPRYRGAVVAGFPEGGGLGAVGANAAVVGDLTGGPRRR